MNVTYDIHDSHALNLGHQYDHNVTQVTFTGFTPVDDTNTIYLKFEGLGLYPLSQMSFEVSQSFTMVSGTFRGQLFEIASDGTLVQNSNVFKIMVKPSIDEYTEIVNNDPSLDLWFTEMSDLYNRVLDKYENGMIVTSGSIINALGYTPADSESIPENVSELVNDSGYLSEITSQNIVNALGYTPADEEDIPTVPINISSFNNDSGYITGISSSDVTGALGYTPVDVDDMSDYLTNISSSDIINALGYTPADGSDMPTVPTNISAFNNDAGYINQLTHDDVIDAIGYVPIDGDLGVYKVVNTIDVSNASDSIVISKDSDGNNINLSAVAIVMSNDNGIRGGTNGYVYAYDADNNIIGGTQVFFYGGASVCKSVVEIEIRGSIVEMNSVGWTASASFSPVNKSIILETGNVGNISKIEVIGNGQAINSGTSISLLGYLSASKQNDGVHVAPGDYYPLKTISLNRNTSSVVINTDLESNTFSISGFVAILENENGIEGGSNGYVYAYDSNDNVVGGTQLFFPGGSTITNSVVEYEIRGDIVEMNSVGWNNNTLYSPTNKSLIGETGSAGDIVKIEIIGNGYDISSGTTIKVYGVKGYDN